MKSIFDIIRTFNLELQMYTNNKPISMIVPKKLFLYIVSEMHAHKKFSVERNEQDEYELTGINIDGTDIYKEKI